MTTAPLNIPSMEDFDIRINKLRQFKNLPELDKQEISNGSNIISTCEWNLDKMQDLTKYISFDDNNVFWIFKQIMFKTPNCCIFPFNTNTNWCKRGGTSYFD